MSSAGEILVTATGAVSIITGVATTVSALNRSRADRELALANAEKARVERASLEQQITDRVLQAARDELVIMQTRFDECKRRLEACEAALGDKLSPRIIIQGETS